MLTYYGKGLTLEALLLSLIQRVPRYQLLLANLLDEADELDPELEGLQSNLWADVMYAKIRHLCFAPGILSTVSSVNAHINQAIVHHDRRQQVCSSLRLASPRFASPHKVCPDAGLTAATQWP